MAVKSKGKRTITDKEDFWRRITWGIDGWDEHLDECEVAAVYAEEKLTPKETAKLERLIEKVWDIRGEIAHLLDKAYRAY